MERDGHLDLGGPVHDYASVFVDGELAGRLDRSVPATNLTLPARRHGGEPASAWGCQGRHKQL